MILRVIRRGLATQRGDLSAVFRRRCRVRFDGAERSATLSLSLKHHSLKQSNVQNVTYKQDSQLCSDLLLTFLDGFRSIDATWYHDHYMVSRKHARSSMK